MLCTCEPFLDDDARRIQSEDGGQLRQVQVRKPAADVVQHVAKVRHDSARFDLHEHVGRRADGASARESIDNGSPTACIRASAHRYGAPVVRCASGLCADSRRLAILLRPPALPRAPPLRLCGAVALSRSPATIQDRASILITRSFFGEGDANGVTSVGDDFALTS